MQSYGFISRSVIALVLVWLPLTASLAAKGKMTRFDARDAAQRDVLQFVSDSPLEKIVGLSNSVAGWLELNPEALSEGIKGEFEADMRTFETGSPIRNDYLRDKFLSTSEFPTGTFTVGKVLYTSKPNLADKQPVVVRLDGTLRLKGQAKSQVMLVKLNYFKQSDMTTTRIPGNLLRISSTFDLDLTQFGIPVPDSMKFRVARFVQVAVDMVASDGPRPVLVPMADVNKPK